MKIKRLDIRTKAQRVTESKARSAFARAMAMRPGKYSLPAAQRIDAKGNKITRESFRRRVKETNRKAGAGRFKQIEDSEVGALRREGVRVFGYSGDHYVSIPGGRPRFAIPYSGGDAVHAGEYHRVGGQIFSTIGPALSEWKNRDCAMNRR